MNELSPIDCEKFDEYVKKWQDILGLLDWRIERSGKRAKKAMCEVVMDDVARMATYRIGLNFGAAEVSPATLESTALHEVLHVLLRDLMMSNEDSAEGLEHKVIHVLEKVLMRAYACPTNITDQA